MSPTINLLEQYRDPKAVEASLSAICDIVTQPWTIMEVCGGQTHAIVRYGIDALLPSQIELVHGPGCPVCVTPIELIDKAVALAAMPDVILCSFGDMLRVPGSRHDLLSVKALGGDVRVVYSPLDCLTIAEQFPDRTIVFFGVGFETTAPANAMTVLQAHERGISNFAMLVSHVLAPPAMASLLASPSTRVQGFLAAGHVCTVMGVDEYEPLAARFGITIVVTGFEPLDLLEGIRQCITMLERGQQGVANQYPRAVKKEGNLAAIATINQVFEIADRKWRGIGVIPMSGYWLRAEFQQYDAEQRFDLATTQVQESPECISGEILQGIKKPHDCSAFGKSCNPQSPLGAPMVSSEGACAAYYHHRRILTTTSDDA